MEVMTVLLPSLATLTRISNRLRALLLSRPDVGSCMGGTRRFTQCTSCYMNRD